MSYRISLEVPKDISYLRLHSRLLSDIQKTGVVQKESIRSLCCCHSHPSLTGWACQSLALCPLTSRAFTHFFAPFHCILIHTERASHMSHFLNVFGTLQLLLKITLKKKTIRNPPDPLSKWDGRPVIIIASQEPEKQLLLYTVDVLPEKVRVVRIKKKKGGFYLMIDVGSH